MLPNRYNLQNIKKALSNPRMLHGELCQLGEQINKKWYQMSSSPKTDIMNRDWDILIILDACRLDYFRELNPFSGELSAIPSAASWTPAFLDYNFSGRQLHDTVYVSGNANSHQLSEDIFHNHIPAFEDRWDETLDVVPPDAMKDETLEAMSAYPNKRIISHFIQPHAPYIGEFGRTLDHNYTHDPDDYIRTVWTNLRYGIGDVAIEDVQKAYCENIELAFNSIREIVDECDQKVVITADHGELFGERERPIPVRGYGHPSNIRIDPLVVVPWFELPFQQRREVVAETPKEQNVNQDVEEKLKALGYR